MIGPPPVELPPPHQMPLPSGGDVNGYDANKNGPAHKRFLQTQSSSHISRRTRLSDVFSSGSGSMLTVHRNSGIYSTSDARSIIGSEDDLMTGPPHSRQHSITFKNSRKLIQSPNARFRSGRNMRIKGKRARDLLRMSVSSNASVDLPPPEAAPSPRRQSKLSENNSAANIVRPSTMTTSTLSDDDERENGYPPPPDIVPPPPAKHSSDDRRISRRRTSPEVMLTSDAAIVLQQHKKDARRIKKRVTLSSDVAGAMVVVPNHPPPPGMPPPGMELRGMSMQSWRLPSDFVVDAVPLTVTLMKNRSKENAEPDADSMEEEKQEQKQKQRKDKGENKSKEITEIQSVTSTPKAAELEQLEESLARAQRGLDAREIALNHEWKRLQDEKMMLQQREQQSKQKPMPRISQHSRLPLEWENDLSLTGLLELWRLGQQETLPLDEAAQAAQKPMPPGNLPTPPNSSETTSLPTAAPKVVPVLLPAPGPTPVLTVEPACLAPTQADELEEEGKRAHQIHEQQMYEFNRLLHALDLVSGTAVPTLGTDDTRSEGALFGATLVPGRGNCFSEVQTMHYNDNVQRQRAVSQSNRSSREVGGGGDGGISISRRSHSRKQRQRTAGLSTRKGWIGTTRRNTLIGVNYGKGSGRVASVDLSQMTMKSGTVPDRLSHMAIRQKKDSREFSKRNALREFQRKRRAAMAGRTEHQRRMRRTSRVPQSHLEFTSQYGVRSSATLACI